MSVANERVKLFAAATCGLIGAWLLNSLIDYLGGDQPWWPL